MLDKNIKKYNFYIEGMHCKSCSLYIKDEISKDKNIKSINVSLKNNSLEVEGDFGEMNEDEIAESLTEYVKERGYHISKINIKKDINWKEFYLSIPIALGVIIIFIALQKAGIINLIGGDSVSLTTAFFIGVVASLSTCMATVGGLLLSISANYSKEGQDYKPHILFHIGRIISFFVFGGVVGAIGSTFKLGIYGMFGMSLFVALIMLVLGINLLDIFGKAKHLQLSLPTSFKKHIDKASLINSSIAPLIIGVLTFILPCGFTQAMQLYSLSLGSFTDGALTMFVFSIGTLPVLALISFGSYSIKNSKNKGVFFKAAGIVVIMFAIYNLINALASISIINPVFSF